MEIIKTYNTRRSTRGSANNASANANAAPAPAAPQNNVPSAIPTSSTATTPSACPATSSSTPAVVAVVPTITTRRSTGRAAAAAAAATANSSAGLASANNANTLSSPALSISSSSEETTTKGQSQSTGDGNNANTNANSTPATQQTQSQPSIIIRTSSRTRRGSASSSSSTATILVTRRRSERGAAQQQATPTTNTTGASLTPQVAPEEPQKQVDQDNRNANLGDNQRCINKNIVESGASVSTNMSTNESANTVVAKDSASPVQTKLKENGDNNNKRKISSGGSVLETSQTVTVSAGEAGATAPSVKSSRSQAIIEIEKSLIAKGGNFFKVKNKTNKSSSKSEEKSDGVDKVVQEEDSLPPILLVDGATGQPLANLSTGVGSSASSEDSNSLQSSEAENSPKQIATTTYQLTVGDDGTIYFNPTTPDVPVIEEGETFSVNLPTHKIKSPSNPLPGLPTTNPVRSRKTKPQAVTYGGESTVGFLDPSIGSQVTMEVGHHHQLQPAGRRNQISGQTSNSGPTAVITLETPPGGDVTSTSTIVSLEVPTGSIDPNYFESQLDPQSIAALENVLQTDQGREILTEALGMNVDVGPVPDSAGAGDWADHGYSQSGKDETVVSSSGVAITPSESPSSTTVSSPRKDGTPMGGGLRGPGRPPGRPVSAGRGSGRSNAGSPATVRKISESDTNIRRSQRQQDRIERQEAERILAENQQMLQREKEQMQAALQAATNTSAPSTPNPIAQPVQPQQQQPVNVGIVSSTQVTPVSSAPPTSTPKTAGSTSEKSEVGAVGGSGRRPVRQRKLPAHLADPNYLSLEDLATVKEASRRSSTATQHEFSEEGSTATSPTSVKAVSEIKQEEEELSQPSTDTQDDTEEDENYTEDDPDRLWCICRQPHNNRFMICCDQCEDWFHGKCVGVTKAQGKTMELKNIKWYCPNCKKTKAIEAKEQQIITKQQHRQEKAASISGKQRKSSGPSIAITSPAATPEQPQQQPHQQQKSVSAKTAKAAAAAAAQKAEAEAAAATALSAEIPSKIAAAAAANKRGRRKSEKGDTLPVRLFEKSSEKEVSSGGTNCVSCKKPARSGSVYCSDLCVQKFSESVGSGKFSPPKEKEKGTVASLVSPSSSTPGPSPVTPAPQKSPVTPLAQSKPKRQNSATVQDPIFNFHVVTPGASVSTEVVPAKSKPQKELTASSLYKKQQQEKAAAAQATTVQTQASASAPAPKISTPTSTPPTSLPTVHGISPNSVNAIVNSSPNVLIRKVDDISSKGMILTMNLINTSASASDLEQEQDSPVSCSEKAERHRTSSTSDSLKSNKSSISSKSSTKETGKEKLERRDSQKDAQISKSDVSSNEKIQRETYRKSLREILKNRLAEVGPSEKKKIEALGNTPETMGIKIEEELYNLFGSASNTKLRNKYRSINFNLKDEKNGIFLEILLGNIKPYDLVRMTTDQMAPSELAQWRKQEEEKGLEAIKRAELEKLAEAKKQELLDKGIDDAVQVAEESKPLDISDVIIDPDAEHKKEKSHKESKDKERSHHHHRDKDRHSHRDKEKDKDRELRSRDKDRDHKSSRDKDKHRHSDRDRDKERKSEKDRHGSSSGSSRHKSSHHDKSKSDRDKDKEEKRRSERHKDKERDKDKDKESSSSKVKHDSKDKESRSDKDRSSRHTRSKDSEKDRDRHRDRDREKQKEKEKDKVSESEKSPKEVSPKDDKVENKEIIEKEKELESSKETEIKQESEKKEENVSSSAKAPPPTSTSVTTTTTTPSMPIEKKEDVKSQALTLNPPVAVASSNDPLKPSSLKEDVRHSSIDSEQELPSSTIKTPDFTEETSSASGGKKENEKSFVFQSVLQMPDLGEFKASFFNVSHEDGTLSGTFFPESPVPCVGRINPQTVWDYIDKMKKTKEIIIFRLAPATPDDAKGYMNYFGYLSSRERLGVMGGLCQPLKDVYLIPLAKHNPIPPCFLPFRGPGLPQERTHCLLAVVTRHMALEQNLKRKIAGSQGGDIIKKKMKAGVGETRILRSSKGKDKIPPPPSVPNALPPPPPTSEGKGDENEPYTPWEDEDDLAPADKDVGGAKTAPTTTSAIPSTSSVVSPALLTSTGGTSSPSEALISMQIKEIEARIAKEQQDITSIILAGSKNIVGIPGLDGDFPVEDSERKEDDSVPSFLRTPKAAHSPSSTAVPAAMLTPPKQQVPQGLSMLDPRSTRSSIFKTQLQQTPPPPILAAQVQTTPPPALVKQSNFIPGLDTVSAPDDSCSPPHLEPEVIPQAKETKEESEEAYSPSAVTFSDEDENNKEQHKEKDLEVIAVSGVPPAKIAKVGNDDDQAHPIVILGSGDIDERVMVMPPITAALPVLPLHPPAVVLTPPKTVTPTVCGDIDERINSQKMEETPSDIPSVLLTSETNVGEKQESSQPTPPLIDLDEKQTEEIKNILSKINIPGVIPIPAPVTNASVSEKEVRRDDDGTVELLDDSEPPPPGEQPPPLPPLRPLSPPQQKNKVFEDSPFEKPALKLGGSSTPGKMKININLSTKILPAAEMAENEKKSTTPEKQPEPLFKDIDERVMPSPVKEPPVLPPEATISLPPVDFMSIPPPGLLGTPPPPISSVPLHLPPPPLTQGPPVTTSVVINLNVPPPPFIPGLVSAPPPGPPPGVIGFPNVPLPNLTSQAGMPQTPPPATQNFMGRQHPSPSSRSPFTSSPIRPPIERIERDPRVERDPGGLAVNERESRSFLQRRGNFGRGHSGDRRRTGRDDNRKRYRSRSRNRSRSRSRSRSRDRNKRRRRHSRSRSRSPARRSSRRNRSRSRSRSPTL